MPSRPISSRTQRPVSGSWKTTLPLAPLRSCCSSDRTRTWSPSWKAITGGAGINAPGSAVTSASPMSRFLGVSADTMDSGSLLATSGLSASARKLVAQASTLPFSSAGGEIAGSSTSNTPGHTVVSMCSGRRVRRSFPVGRTTLKAPSSSLLTSTSWPFERKLRVGSLWFANTAQQPTSSASTERHDATMDMYCIVSHHFSLVVGPPKHRKLGG
mmetsp:Transcript_115978/g.370008  ORF Transcript_115978/g.370008 Transcript_115978/m.370008 type:complete len:214 (-) Transcript_115978:195-836(-)